MSINHLAISFFLALTTCQLSIAQTKFTEIIHNSKTISMTALDVESVILAHDKMSETDFATEPTTDTTEDNLRILNLFEIYPEKKKIFPEIYKKLESKRLRFPNLPIIQFPNELQSIPPGKLKDLQITIEGLPLTSDRNLELTESPHFWLIQFNGKQSKSYFVTWAKLKEFIHQGDIFEPEKNLLKVLDEPSKNWPWMQSQVNGKTQANTDLRNLGLAIIGIGILNYLKDRTLVIHHSF